MKAERKESSCAHWGYVWLIFLNNNDLRVTGSGQGQMIYCNRTKQERLCRMHKNRQKPLSSVLPSKCRQNFQTCRQPWAQYCPSNLQPQTTAIAQCSKLLTFPWTLSIKMFTHTYLAFASFKTFLWARNMCVHVMKSNITIYSFTNI